MASSGWRPRPGLLAASAPSSSEENVVDGVQRMTSKRMASSGWRPRPGLLAASAPSSSEENVVDGVERLASSG